MALVDKGLDLDQTGRHDEARAAYQKVIDTYSADIDPGTREQVAKARDNLH
jgi:TolA-binding protein